MENKEKDEVQVEAINKAKIVWRKPQQKTVVKVALCAILIVLGIRFIVMKEFNFEGYAKGHEFNQKVLDDEQKASFDFMWESTNKDLQSPGYGLVKDRATNEKMSSVASVGFALTGYGIGAENGWISKEEGQERALNTLKTLWNNAEHVEGFFYHFLDMNTAQRYEEVEVSMIDTAIAVNGALFAGEYFGGEVQEYANKIYERVNWDWYRNPKTNKFYMEYKPEKGEHTGTWAVYAEQFMAYFLGAASPTHPVPADMINEISRESTTWAGMPPYISSPANSIFTYQFSQAWFDLENMVDNKGYDWYNNSVIATLASRQYSIDTREIFKTFGPNAWGLTACDGPFGYSGHYGANPENPVDGTIPPAGAGGSAPYTPQLVAEAFENYHTIDGLWDSAYGFKDAYNSEGDGTIIMEDHLTIDKGITMLMIENQKSRLVWDIMNKNEYVQAGKKLTGFMEADTRVIEDGDAISNSKGLKGEGVKISESEEASSGPHGMKLDFAQESGSQDIEIELKSMKLDERVVDAIALDVKGKVEVSASVYDKKDKEIGSSKSIQIDANEYEEVILPIDAMKEEPDEIKKVVLHMKNTEKSVLVDEVRFTATQNMARNATISERPYVGGKLSVYFDYISQNENESEPLFAYQWMISDSMKEDFKNIKGANEPTYIPTEKDVDKFLKVKVTPVNANGDETGLASESIAVSKVSKTMPTVSEDIKATILKHRGRVPDVISNDTFSILKYWKDGGQEVYDIGDKGEKLITKFEKENMEYPYMIRNITVADISKFKSLAFHVEGDAKILLKLEEKDAKVIGEVEIDTANRDGYYEWDLSQHEEQLKNVGNILIFALPGEMSGSGEFTFDKFEFSVEQADENVVYSKGMTPEPTNYYDGISSIFDFNHKWMDGGDNVYAMKEDAKGTNVQYKKQGSPEWALAKSNIAGNLSKFQKVVFEISGHEGAKILFKTEGEGGNSESGILTLSGGRETIEINLNLLSAAQKNSLSKVMLFMEPMQTTGSGQLQIHKAYFSKDAFTGGDFVKYVHRYDGQGDTFNINSKWYDNGDGVYKIQNSNNQTVVSYGKHGGSEYAFMNSLMDGNFTDFTYLNFNVQGNSGERILFKIEGSSYIQEYMHTFSGDDDVISIALDKQQDPNSIKQALAFIAPGKTSGSGSFEINEAYFSKTRPINAPIETIHEYTGNKVDFHVNSGWKDSGDGVYKIKEQGGNAFVNYQKEQGQEYASFATRVEGNLSDFAYLYIDAQGDEGKKLLVKLESSGYIKEELIAFNGQRQTIVIPIDHDQGLNHIKKILMFASPNKIENGALTIYDMYFSNTKPNDAMINEYNGDKQRFHFNKLWRDGGDGAHTITQHKESVHVDVQKVQGQEYASMYTPIKGNFSDFNRLYVDVKGDAGKQILVKLEKDGFVKEEWITFSGKRETIAIALDTTQGALDALDKVMIFGAGGKIENISFDIYDMYFDNEAAPSINEYTGGSADFNINKYWKSNEQGVYDFSNEQDKTVVSSNKLPGNEYSYFYSPVKGNFSDFNYMSMKVQGVAGQQILLKVENEDATENKEWYINLDGSLQQLQIDMKDITFRNEFTKVMVFTTPGSLINTSISIAEMKFTNTLLPNPTPTENEYTGGGADFSANDLWISKDAGVYTKTEANGVTTITSHKNGANAWSYFYSPIKGNFSDFNYLNMEVKGEVGKKVMVKLETTGRAAVEHTIVLNGEKQLVQIDISTLENRNALSGIMMFMEPGATTDSTLEIHKAMFTNTKVASTLNEYTGGGADFSINKYWKSNEQGVYDIADEQGKTVVTSNKVAGNEYSYFYSPIKGNFSDFNYMNMKVQGVAGQQVLIKVENKDATVNKEWYVNLDGSLQQLQIDMKDITFRNEFTKVMVFTTPGSLINTSISIAEMKFTNTMLPSPTPTENVYTGGGADFSANSLWTSKDAGVHTMQEVNGITTVTSHKNGANENKWSYFYSPIKGNFTDFNYLNMEVKGESGKEVMVKLETTDNTVIQHTIALNGEKQLVQIDISTLVSRNDLTSIMMFMTPDKTIDSTLEIHKAIFTNTKVASTVNEYTGGGADFSANSLWTSKDAGVYTMQEVNGITTVTSHKNGANENAWSYFYSPIKGNFSDFNYLNMEVKGESGKEVMVKLETTGNPAIQHTIALNGEKQLVQIDISTLVSRNDLTSIMMFMTPNTTTDSTLEIHKATFTNTKVLPPVNEYTGGGADFSVVDNWYDNGDKDYTITKVNNSTQIDVVKPADHPYSAAAVGVKGNFSDFAYLHVEVSGTVGEQVMVKLEGNNPSEKIEQFIILDSNKKIVSIPLRLNGAKRMSLDSLEKVILFADPGKTNAKTMQVVLHTMYFSNTLPVDNVYSGTGAFHLLANKWNYAGVYSDGGFDASSGGRTIGVDKANQGYDGITYPLPSGTFTKLQITFRFKESSLFPEQNRIIAKIAGNEPQIMISNQDIYTLEVPFVNNQNLTMMMLGGQIGNAKVEILDMKLLP